MAILIAFERIYYEMINNHAQHIVIEIQYDFVVNKLNYIWAVLNLMENRFGFFLSLSLSCSVVRHHHPLLRSVLACSKFSDDGAKGVFVDGFFCSVNLNWIMFFSFFFRFIFVFEGKSQKFAKKKLREFNDHGSTPLIPTHTHTRAEIRFPNAKRITNRMRRPLYYVFKDCWIATVQLIPF